MRDAIAGLVEKVDAAIAESVGVVPEDDLERLARFRHRIVERLAYPDDVLVVALAGGTGSGKSSIFNAVAGAEIAEVGGIRPTTSEPLALVAPTKTSILEGYLRGLEVGPVTIDNALPWLCLIDLPDTDSIAVEHLHSVESLINRVDVVVWVVDPEKYGDAALHTRLLGPLIDYQEQFVFVLNQMDRVPNRDRVELRDDFARKLGKTGIESPLLLTTSGSPVSGPPEGVDRLVETLGAFHAKTSPAHMKLLSDLRAIAAGLVEVTPRGSSVDFEDRWRDTIGEVALSIAEGESARGGHQLGLFLEGLARDVGGESGGALAEKALQASSFAEGSSALAADADRYLVGKRTGLFSGKAKSARPSEEMSGTTVSQIVDKLEEEVGEPVRQVLARRARSHAAIADLHLSVSGLAASVS